jgi:hypothetical protein
LLSAALLPLVPSIHSAENFGFDFALDHPFFTFNHFPEFKVKLVKFRREKCDGEDGCDNYKCDDDCEDEDEEDDNSCDRKYVRRCRYRHNNEKVRGCGQVTAVLLQGPSKALASHHAQALDRPELPCSSNSLHDMPLYANCC